MIFGQKKIQPHVLVALGNESPRVNGNLYLPFLVKFVQLWYIVPKLTNKDDDKIALISCQQQKYAHSSHKTEQRSVFNHPKIRNKLILTHLTYNFSTASIDVLQGCPFHMLQLTKREVISSCGHSKKPSKPMVRTRVERVIVRKQVKITR